MMDLSEDIIGTNPKSPSVVDHSWMNPNPPGYDNYPSDNNPVRVLPKLSELWRTDDVGFSIAPNQAGSLMGRFRSATDEEDSNREVVREACKAAMAGLSGAGLAEHLRGLFTPSQIKAAGEELSKVASEVGLLGNVYIDARAFSTLDEADKFMGRYRSKLARDLLYDSKTMNKSVVAILSTKYRKKAVNDMVYDQELFDHYKDHLVLAGRIPSDFVINSKETLKQAFQHEMPQEEAPAPVVQVNKLSIEEISRGLREMAERNAKIQQEMADVNLLKLSTPVVAFVQENLSKGKTGKELKEMIRGKFASEDINTAGKLIAFAVSERGLSEEHINERVAKGQISELIGDELKKIAKKFPVKKAQYPDNPKTDIPITGVEATFHAPLARVMHDELEPYRKKAFEALKHGYDPQKVLSKLSEKLPVEKAGQALSDAVAQLNAMPSGAVANRAARKRSGPVESLTASSPLPSLEQTEKEYDETLQFFAGSGELPVEITPERKFSSIDVGDLGGSSGIDAMLGG